MSIVTLIAPKKQRVLGPITDEGGLKLDAVLQEAFEIEVDVTQYPIEKGADISDHAIVKPAIYTLTGVVTDNPLKWSSTSYQHSDSRVRHLSAFAILRDLANNQQLFDLEATGFLPLENCVLAGFHSEKDAVKAHTFNFDAIVKVINVVETEVVAITADMVAAGDQAEAATDVQDAGPQSPVEQTTLLNDIISGVTNAVSGLLGL